jgi:hypothetical protein
MQYISGFQGYVVCPKCKAGVGIYKNSIILRTHTRRKRQNRKLVWSRCEYSGKELKWLISHE